MLDIGLLASMVILLTVTTVFIRPWPPGALSAGLLDTTLGAAGLGLLIGRLTSLALDDPGSLLNVRDVLIIRSGVEFWPGALAATAWLSLRARREGAAVGQRLAALAPAALVAWGCYEATCLLRDGCPGPLARLGLRPVGLHRTVFPIGLAVAGAALLSAVLVDRLSRRRLRAVHVVVITGGLVAAIRSVASVWLPRIGEGLTRQHRESLVALIISTLTLVVMLLVDRPTHLARRAQAQGGP